MRYKPEEILELLKTFPGTMYQLADLTGVTQGTLLRLKKTNTPPAQRTADRIAEALRLDDYYHFCDAERRDGVNTPAPFWPWFKRFRAGLEFIKEVPDAGTHTLSDAQPAYLPGFEPKELDDARDQALADLKRENAALYELVDSQRAELDSFRKYNTILLNLLGKGPGTERAS